MRTIALFLGAGFSKPWGLPLTKDLLPVKGRGVGANYRGKASKKWSKRARQESAGKLAEVLE
jgi:hypothetical protein